MMMMQLLSDSLNVTSKFFKGLIKKTQEEEHHPFSKGAMAFDDYSYRFYNEAIFNPKSLKLINEDDDVKSPKEALNKPDDESVLT